MYLYLVFMLVFAVLLWLTDSAKLPSDIGIYLLDK